MQLKFILINLQQLNQLNTDKDHIHSLSLRPFFLSLDLRNKILVSVSSVGVHLFSGGWFVGSWLMNYGQGVQMPCACVVRCQISAQGMVKFYVMVVEWFALIFYSSCSPTRGHIERFTRNSNTVMTSSAGGAKGCSDHRFRNSLELNQPLPATIYCNQQKQQSRAQLIPPPGNYQFNTFNILCLFLAMSG